MKATSTLELQMELQKVRMLCKKRRCKRFFFALIAKICKNFKKMYKILEFGLSFFQMSVSGERDNWKEPSKYLET